MNTPRNTAAGSPSLTGGTGVNTQFSYRKTCFLREEPDGKVITLWQLDKCEECGVQLANGLQKLFTTLSDQELQQRGATLMQAVPTPAKRFSPHAALICGPCYNKAMNPQKESI